MPNAEVI
jgi:hypothetical protein